MQPYCKDCASEYMKQWNKDNPDWRLLRDYNITLVQRDAMVESQGNCCAICRTPFSEAVFPCVDHCHSSTQVRGILCHHCNTGIGQFRDSPKLLQQAIYYIDYHAQKIAASSLSTRDHQQSEDDAKYGPLFATGTGEDDDDAHHHCGTISGEDIDHRAQESSGDSVGHGSQEVEPSEPFTRIEDYGQPDAEIVRLEFGRRNLFD